jgi:hypothetical protein
MTRKLSMLGALLLVSSLLSSVPATARDDGVWYSTARWGSPGCDYKLIYHTVDNNRIYHTTKTHTCYLMSVLVGETDQPDETVACKVETLWNYYWRISTCVDRGSDERVACTVVCYPDYTK